MLLSLDDAFKIIEDVVQPILQTESCFLTNALNRVTAADIIAPYALPPFTNTGVDGYAFRHSNIQKEFHIIGASFAGEPFNGVIESDQAVRIATGAVLPNGADTVVMQEVCVVKNNILHITDLPAKGTNLRHAGGDVAKGSIAVKKKEFLGPQDIAFLSALGVSEINVIRPLRIAVISTGLELCPSGGTSAPGQIVDTNSLMLTQMLQSSRVEITRLATLPDVYETTRKSLQNASTEYDIVITTGGVSVGDRDYIRDVLHAEGKVHFYKLAIRPGKPVIFGHIGSCIMLGLPGNPVSAFVTCILIARAVLNALWSRPVILPEGFDFILEDEIAKPEMLRAFPRARHVGGRVFPFKDQSSNLYSSLVNADGLLDLPAERAVFKKGDIVTFRPFDILF